MITITGQVLGSKSERRKAKDGSEFEVHHVGIQTEKENGYDGEMVIHDLAVSQAQFKAGILAYYQNFIGKVVEVPIWLSSWSSVKGNSGINKHLSGDGKAREAKSTS